MRIVNLTQHAATPEQRAAGVVDPSPSIAERVHALLTFEALPTPALIRERAAALAELAADLAGAGGAAMIGGAPFLMTDLELALLQVGVAPLYAFSRREAVDVTGADGAVRKTSVFRHLGFVPAPGTSATVLKALAVEEG